VQPPSSLRVIKSWLWQLAVAPRTQREDEERMKWCQSARGRTLATHQFLHGWERADDRIGGLRRGGGGSGGSAAALGSRPRSRRTGAGVSRRRPRSGGRAWRGWRRPCGTGAAPTRCTWRPPSHGRRRGWPGGAKGSAGSWAPRGEGRRSAPESGPLGWRLAEARWVGQRLTDRSCDLVSRSFSVESLCAKVRMRSGL
jgi:hypothetical protein